MATHSSILAWKIPGTEESGGLWSIWSQSDATEHAHNTRIKDVSHYPSSIKLKMPLFMKWEILV